METELSLKSKDISRKYKLAVVVIALATLLRVGEFVSGAEWVEVAKWALVAYCGANLFEKGITTFGVKP